MKHSPSWNQVRGMMARLGEWRRRLVAGAAGLLLANFLMVGIWIVWGMDYVHFSVAQIGAVSWYFAEGHPLYHAVDAAERYSLLYGPSPYLLNAGIMKLVGPGFSSSEVGGVTCAVLAVVIVWRIAGMVGLGYAMLTLGLFQMMPYTKGEPILLLCVAAALWGALRLKRVGTAIVLAIAIGVAVNVKIHAVVYLLPVAAIVWERHGWTWAALGLVGSVVVLAAPFALFRNISAANYVAWVRLAGRHKFSGPATAQVIIALVVLLMPVALGWIAAPRWARGRRMLLCALASGVAAACVVGSKIGAGAHHLIPFTVMFAYVVGEELKAVAETSRTVLVTQAGAVAFAVLALRFSIPDEVALLRQLCDSQRTYRDVIQDIEQIRGRYAGRRIEIGYGTPDKQRVYMMEPKLVFEGNPYLVDAAALNDMAVGGLEIPAATLAAIRSDVVEVWLMPKGSEPFVWESVYEGRETFSAEFRRAFLDSHEKRESTRYFDVWVSRR